MAEDRRTPRADVVDVFPTVDVPDPRTGRALDEKWLASYAAEGAHWRIHASRNYRTSAGQEFCGARHALRMRTHLCGRQIDTACGRPIIASLSGGVAKWEGRGLQTRY